MKVKCPNCRHEFAVELTAVDPIIGLPERYRNSVAWLQRHQSQTAASQPRTIQPTTPDPDRPVSR